MLILSQNIEIRVQEEKRATDSEMVGWRHSVVMASVSQWTQVWINSGRW